MEIRILEFTNQDDSWDARRFLITCSHEEMIQALVTRAAKTGIEFLIRQSRQLVGS